MDYGWKRFFCTRIGAYHLDDQGFLLDPEADYSKYYGQSAVDIETVLQKQCVVFLGEPGIGKSFEIQSAQRRESDSISETNDRILSIDLRCVGSQEVLYRKLFDTREFQEWLNGDFHLYLYLDSLDEGLMSMKELSPFLQEEFRRIPVERLHLRIACRTAEWPETLGNTLMELFNKNDMEIYELVMLRKKDVKSAAISENVNPEHFIEQIIQQDVVAFAIKPVTLKMLLNIYKQSGALPETKSGVYEKGCLLLCADPDEERRRHCRYTPETLFAVAARIAALTIFCNKYCIFTDIDQGNLQPEDIPLQSLSGGTESFDGQMISIDDHILKATLNTGLFTSRGPYRMGWAHLTYAEYLAAQYPKRNNMADKQILSLLLHSELSCRKIVPQLYETAAWIANLNQDVMLAILNADPAVLMRSDISNLEPKLKEVLVLKILQLAESVQVKEDSIRDCYHKLKHPNLSVNLRPYLTEKSKHFLSRRMAIDIAEACKEVSLLPELLSIVLDRGEDSATRKNAAYAIAEIGDTSAKLEMRQLISNSEDDPEDDLKGCALRCLFPEHLSVAELFENLTVPKNDSYFGSYAMFLSSFAKTIHIEPADYVYALEWICRGRWHEHHLRSIKDKIIIDAWEHLLRNPALVNPYARALWLLIQEHAIVSVDDEYSLHPKILKERDKARLVAKEIISLYKTEIKYPYLVFSVVPLITDDDVLWLIEQCRFSVPNEARIWADILRNFCFNVKYYDDIIEAMNSNPFIAAALEHLQPVIIESPEGRNIRAYYLRHLRRERMYQCRNIRPSLSPPPIERVRERLEAFENGNRDAWWHLNMAMTLKPDSRRNGDEFESDLRKLPVWEEGDTELRLRIFNAAKVYIGNPPQLDSDWVISNTLNRPWMAGYRAFELILHIEPDYLNTLDNSVWNTWAPVFVKYLMDSSHRNEETCHILTKMAYDNAPDQLLNNLSRMLDFENQTQEFVFVRQSILDCFDDRIGRIILQKATSPETKEKAKKHYWEKLLENKFQPAIEHARDFVSRPIPIENDIRTEHVFFAVLLVHYCPDIASEIVWQNLYIDEQYGVDLITGVSEDRDFRHGNISSFASKMNEEGVANLYIWIEERYPHNEDPHHEGCFSPGFRDQVAELRNGLIQHLQNRGTFEACEELRRMSTRFPDHDSIKWVLVSAEENARRETWNPLLPEQMLKLAHDASKRFIENGTELLDCILDVLAQLETDLHGEKPRIETIWDNKGDARTPKWCPKEETALSASIDTYLDEHLARKGIVVNREVEIRRGEKTDIHIVAVNPMTHDQIKVIIEVKGCWHKELKTAMQSQLADTYLNNNQCPNGIYLIGWFLCDRWDGDDYRKNVTPNWELPEARDFFECQAKDLTAQQSSDVIIKSFVLDTRL